MRTLVILVVLLAVVLLAGSCLYAVDRTEFAYLTQFGRHLHTYDGAKDAGLHWKLPWPIQSVQRLERRLQVFDVPGAELLTHDPRGKTIDRTLTIDTYVCWRIADKLGEQDSVDWFVRRVGTPEMARTILEQRLKSQLGAAIGQMELDDLISTEPGKVDANMQKLRERLLAGLQGQARENYGIEIVDIRLRRFNHPVAVRDAIFDRIRSERNKKVADYRSEGTKLAEDIKSAADRKARDLLADARAEEQKLKGQAEAEADRIRNQAHSKDPEYYAFLKKLEEYQRILGDNKTVLLLSAHRDLFDLLFKPPKPVNGNPTTRPAAGPVPSKEPVKNGVP